MSANPHRLETLPDSLDRVSTLQCAADGCAWQVIGIFRTEWFARRYFADAHAEQYEPGRVPDIEPSYVLVVDCSVCPDGGKVEDVDSDVLRCDTCGASWDRDGRGGETAEAGS